MLLTTTALHLINPMDSNDSKSLGRMEGRVELLVQAFAEHRQESRDTLSQLYGKVDDLGEIKNVFRVQIAGIEREFATHREARKLDSTMLGQTAGKVTEIEKKIEEIGGQIRSINDKFTEHGPSKSAIGAALASLALFIAGVVVFGQNVLADIGLLKSGH